MAILLLFCYQNSRTGKDSAFKNTIIGVFGDVLCPFKYSSAHCVETFFAVVNAKKAACEIAFSEKPMRTSGHQET